MGINLSWIAVEGVGRDEVLKRLGFEAVGDTSDEIGAPFCCAVLPGDWVVVTASRGVFVTDKSLAAASSGAFALGGEMVETVMFSRLRAFRGGVQVWSVRHDCEKDGDGVLVVGEPPPSFAELQTRLQAEQEAHQDEPVDYLFDLPPELSEQLCGYRPGSGPRREWVIIERTRARRTVITGKSLLAEMEAKLLPNLLSRGWSQAMEQPSLAGGNPVVRMIDGDEQSIWLEYREGRQTWIELHFIATIPNASEVDKKVHGRVQRPRLVRPLWKRLWSRPSPPERRVDEAIEGALREFDVVDTFLKTFKPHPWIRIDHRYRGPPPEEGDGET